MGEQDAANPADSNALASAILASAAHLIIATDPRGVVTLFNGASEQALGYRASEVVGRETPALWHDEAEVVQRAEALSQELGIEVQPGFGVFIEKPRREGTESIEWTFIRKDGTRFPADLTVTCIREANGEITGYLGVIKDISDHKASELSARKARDEITEAKAFLDLINRNNPDLVFVKDRQFRIVEANPAFLAVYPKDKRDQVIGYTTFENYSEEEAAVFLKMDQEAFEKGFSETLERVTFSTGDTRLLNTKKIRFENSRGEPFILGIARDVTEREALIEKLKETNEELEEFAYRTSHDLRSPLVSSIGLLDVAREAIEDRRSELALESLQHTRRSLKKLETLVKDILSLTQTKNSSERAQRIDVEALINESISKLSHMENFERLEMQMDLKFEAPVVLKRGRIALIVENLISNAIKYQDVSEATSFVRIVTRAERGNFVLEVMDNGLGVPPEHRPKLFKMFRRFHSRVAFGSGLGLYLMKKSAEVLGGDLAFEELGKGAKFKLSIPTQAMNR